MKRGEIWWAELPLPSGRRPVVLVSRASAYDVRVNLIVAEVSRTRRNLPSEVTLSKGDGIPTTCVVNTDNLVTIPRTWLKTKLCQLSAMKVEALHNALAFSLGLD